MTFIDQASKESNMEPPLCRKGVELIMEMPSEVVSMETIDGRLWVTLATGQTIDMTDLTAGTNPQ